MGVVAMLWGWTVAKAIVPMSVSERFAPAERPSFKLLRRAGRCCLWRSQTIAHEVDGHARAARVHYHLTSGDEAQAVLMPNFETAMRVLAKACGRVAP